jgi:hypothetical protein
MSQPPPLPKSWTVMVFMAVDDDLAPYALADIRQMQTVGSSADVDLVVQLQWKHGAAERYHILPKDIQKLEASGALAEFLHDAAIQFPADRYMLELWGHAYGLGFGRSVDDRIPLAEIVRVLDAFARSRHGRKLDLLAGVACRMSKLETVYELREVVHYLLASQVGVPLLGWPYKAFLDDLIRTPALTGDELGRRIVAHFCDAWRRRTVTMTLLDLEADAPLLAALQTLARTVYAEVRAADEDPDSIHQAFLHAAADDVEPLVDLYDLCESLAIRTRSAPIRLAVERVLEAFRDSGFVTAHDGVGPRAARLHGLGISLPQVVFDPASPRVAALGLDQSRLWRDVFLEMAREGQDD